MGCCSDEKHCGDSGSSRNSCCCCCSCHTEQESCDKEHSESKSYFLDIADEAWEEVLKDKIKEHILKTQNDRMTELAKVVSEGNNRRWKHRMEKKHSCQEFEEEICRFFSQFKK
jgi:hypothetical protein